MQKRVKPIIEDADAARAASKTYWKNVNAYYDAPGPQGRSAAGASAGGRSGIAALEGCYRRLDKLEGELQLVIDVAKNNLAKAAKHAPDKPPASKGWDKVKKGLGDFAGGAGDTLYDWYEGFGDLWCNCDGCRTSKPRCSLAARRSLPPRESSAAPQTDAWATRPGAEVCSGTRPPATSSSPGDTPAQLLTRTVNCRNLAVILMLI